MEELKPCPFCGEPGEVVLDDPQEPESCWMYWVGCNNLECPMMPQARVYARDVKAKINDWNTRAEE